MPAARRPPSRQITARQGRGPRRRAQPELRWRAAVQLVLGAALASRYGRGMSMRHHHLPAAFIARFSKENGRPARGRRVSVLRKSWLSARSMRASEVGCEKEFYSFKDNRFSRGVPLDMIDQVWQAYENRLNLCVNALISSTDEIDARIWSRTLVPFVAGLFVRNPDFDVRYRTRIAELFGHCDDTNDVAHSASSPDQINMARMVELHRLLSGIMTADWDVLHFAPDEPIVTNDLGYAFQEDRLYDDLPGGVIIPLQRTEALVVMPRCINQIAHWTVGGWMRRVEHFEVPHGYMRERNRAIAWAAREFIIGTDADEIEQYGESLREESPSIEPAELGLATAWVTRRREHEWHRLVSALERTPEEILADGFEIDFESIVADWHPTMIFPAITNRQSQTALAFDGRGIYLNLVDFEGRS